MYQTAAIASAVLILYVASLVAHVNLVNGVMLTVSVRKIAAYQTVLIVFVVPILFAGSLVAAAVVPKPATPRVNASALRTALVVFVVLILFVRSRAEPVIVMRPVMPLANVFLPASNGYASKVVALVWVLMMGDLMKSQFIALQCLLLR